MKIKAFLGPAGYYRKFMPQHASISAPLAELLKKGKPEQAQWIAECEFQNKFKCKLSDESLVHVESAQLQRALCVQIQGRNWSCTRSNRQEQT